jgi:hypothetical protein
MRITYGDLFLCLLAVLAAVLVVEASVREAVLGGIRADWRAISLAADPATRTAVGLSRATGRNLLLQALLLPVSSLVFMLLAAVGIRLNWRRGKAVTAR